MSFDYAKALYSVPENKAAAHRGAWDFIAAPGSWWSGAERVAIAQAVRDAADCTLCRERKAALSPLAVTGSHSGTAQVLSEKTVDAVHRVTTDSARLTESWIAGLTDEDFGYGHYVEMVGVIVALISIDTFHMALGLPLEPLPEPIEGKPDGYTPPGAAIDVAWVPMIMPENLTEREDDIYHGAPEMAHVIRALSLVPDAVRWLSNLSDVHYLPFDDIRDLSSNGDLAISRMQVELVAARTSRFNDCFY